MVALDGIERTPDNIRRAEALSSHVAVLVRLHSMKGEIQEGLRNQPSPERRTTLQARLAAVERKRAEVSKQAEHQYFILLGQRALHLRKQMEARVQRRVREAIASDAASPRARRLNWRILPAEGGFDLFRQSQLVGARQLSDEAGTRLECLWRLGPKAWYVGEELGSRLYYVAVFDGVAVAESPDYGNALYYYRCDDALWQDVFSQEKQEARRLGAKRIIHGENWEAELERVVRQARHASRP